MEGKKQKPRKPPLGPARIAGELLAGTLGGIIGVGPLIELARDKYSEWGFGYILMFLLTYPLGGLISTVGVYLVGIIGNQIGSFWATLGCTVLGASAAFIIAFAADIGHWAVGNGALFAILCAAPTLGAVVGFNLTRRYKSPPEP